MAELTRDQRNLEEEVEDDSSLTETPDTVNGEAKRVDVIASPRSVTEEKEDCRANRPSPPITAPPQENTAESSPPPQTQDSSRSSVEVGGGLSHPSPSSPTLEERRRPGTLLIWQERERIHQQRDNTARDNGLLKITTAKTGSNVATLSQTGSSSSGSSPEDNHSQNGLRQRCASADQMSLSQTAPVQRSVSRSDVPSSPKASSPPGLSQKPNSFLFRTSSRCSVKSQFSISGSTQSLVEAGRSDLAPCLRPQGPGPACTPPHTRTPCAPPVLARGPLPRAPRRIRPPIRLALPPLAPPGPISVEAFLANGTAFCPAANHRPACAVSIIHIPSPAVPKLSTAKCRLNVENFISACRRLGVPETEVCVLSDVYLCKLPAVLRCVEALVKCEVEGDSPYSPYSSLLSEGFLVFYSLVMILLYTLYYHLVS
nr:leucine-rich repeat and calponin homology domain-containing protein 4-like [Oncorhynchus nerka]